MPNPPQPTPQKAPKPAKAPKSPDNVIRFRAEPSTRVKLNKITSALNKKRPRGSKEVTLSEAIRMAVYEFAHQLEAAKA